MLTLVPKPNDTTPPYRLNRVMEALFQDLKDYLYLGPQLVTAIIEMQDGTAVLHEAYSEELLDFFYGAYDRSEFSDEPEDMGRLVWMMDTVDTLSIQHGTNDLDIPDDNKAMVLYEFQEFAPAFTKDRSNRIPNTVADVKENTSGIVRPALPGNMQES